MRLHYSILIFVLISLLFGCKPDTTNNRTYFNFSNGWEKDNLLGKVQSIETYIAAFNPETEETLTPIIKGVKRYNPLGDYTLIERYDQFGHKEYSYLSKYNSENKLINTKEEYLLLFKKTEKKYAYNVKDNKVIIKHYTNDSLSHTVFQFYNSSDQLNKTVKSNGKDSIIIKYNFEYDSLNRNILEKAVTIDPNGTHINTVNKEYDSEGRLIHTINVKGNLGKKEIIYLYSGNELTKATHYTNGFITSEINYDNWFNPILIRSFKSASLIKEIKFKYQYDNMGNWKKRNKFVKDITKGDRDFVLRTKELRKIKYYQ